jgi:histidine ammonia-lyase
MGMNAAIITDRVIENAYQVMAIEFVALCQAVDILEAKNKLSSASLSIYNAIRNLVATCEEDAPQFEQIKAINDFLKNYAK